MLKNNNLFLSDYTVQYTANTGHDTKVLWLKASVSDVFKNFKLPWNIFKNVEPRHQNVFPHWILRQMSFWKNRVENVVNNCILQIKFWKIQ